MRLTRPLALALVLLALSAGRTDAASPVPAPKPAEVATDILPFHATETTLPNGLRVIVVPTGFPNIVSLQIPVKTGSRNEVEPGKSGFAHFFEHMMFRGTKAYPPEKYQAIVTRSGARQNAYTTDDLHELPHDVPEGRPRDDAQDRGRPLPEPRVRRVGVQDRGPGRPRRVQQEQRKPDLRSSTRSRATRRSTSTRTSTRRWDSSRTSRTCPTSTSTAKTFFDRWYRPENTTIIVAGDVQPAETIRMIEKYWGVWKKGSHTVTIPQEPPAKGPVTAHVPWPSDTLPWVVVAFHGPAFSETKKDLPALDALFDLSFGPTSDLYKKLVEREQKVDALQPNVDINEDPELVGVFARLKKGTDPVYVRDEILATVAALRDAPVGAKRLADVKSNARYSLVRGLDDTERIAGLLARFVRLRRSYGTINGYYRLVDSLTPADLQAAARTYLTDENLVLTTLSKDPMPEAMAVVPPLARFGSAAKPEAPGPDAAWTVQKSPLPRLEVKLTFAAGSAHDPAGKEGLAALTARMITDGGSQDLRIDEIRKALFPVAASLDSGVDREVTILTGVVHKDAWQTFADVALPQLIAPGFREEDFRRIKDALKNALVQNLRNNNDEELGKERLQQRIFAGTPYGHPTLGTVAGLDAITLDDVKAFAKAAYTRAALTVGVAGDVPDAFSARLKADLAKLQAGPALPAPAGVVGRKPSGIDVDIVKKETRSTAISFGFPIDVTRSHPDFAALSVARSWLGEHRSSSSHLYQRIREVRGMNYGDYAYIEAFPGGMYRMLPDAGVPRRNQLFEIWLRPVMPQNAHMALRVAIAELDKLVAAGLSEEDFQTTRDYLMKNVYLLTATQDHALGYALDQKWYGLPDYVTDMRAKLGELTRADVNAAVKRHLQAKDFTVVAVTKDAEGLRDALVSDGFSPIKYDGEKSKELLDEDKVIGGRKLGVKAEAVTITPVEDVFAK